MNVKEQIIRSLYNGLNVERLDVRDQTAEHIGHKGARESGGGHFDVLIVSDDFKGKSLMNRHRMVYGILKKEMGGSIHALSIKALTVKEHGSGP